MAEQMYRVVVPYVTLKVKDATGTDVILGFYQGAVVSDADVNEESLQHHVEGDMLQKVSEKDLYAPFTGPEGASAPSDLTDDDLEAIDKAKPAAAKKAASPKDA